MKINEEPPSALGDHGLVPISFEVRSVLEDLQDNVLGIWAWLR